MVAVKSSSKSCAAGRRCRVTAAADTHCSSGKKRCCGHFIPILFILKVKHNFPSSLHIFQCHIHRDFSDSFQLQCSHNPIADDSCHKHFHINPRVNPVRQVPRHHLWQHCFPDDTDNPDAQRNIDQHAEHDNNWGWHNIEPCNLSFGVTENFCHENRLRIFFNDNFTQQINKNCKYQNCKKLTSHIIPPMEIFIWRVILVSASRSITEPMYLSSISVISELEKYPPYMSFPRSKTSFRRISGNPR